MQVIVLDSNGAVVEVVKEVRNYIGEVDKVTFFTDEGGEGSFAGFQCGYCVVDDEVDPESVTIARIVSFLKPYKIADLQKECNEAIANGFIYTNGDEFSFDAEQQSDFYQKQLLLFFNPSLSGVQLLTKNAGIKTYEKSDFINIVTFANQFKDSLNKKLQDLTEQINETEYNNVNQLKQISFVDYVLETTSNA